MAPFFWRIVCLCLSVVLYYRRFREVSDRRRTCHLVLIIRFTNACFFWSGICMMCMAMNKVV